MTEKFPVRARSDAEKAPLIFADLARRAGGRCSQERIREAEVVGNTAPGCRQLPRTHTAIPINAATLARSLAHSLTRARVKTSRVYLGLKSRARARAAARVHRQRTPHCSVVCTCSYGARHVYVRARARMCVCARTHQPDEKRKKHAAFLPPSDLPATAGGRLTLIMRDITRVHE